jgi:choline-glycine betaine transporter
MTFRSCFYPMLGSFTWGWIGDLVDGATIVMTVAGLVSTLTIAAGHVASGLQHLGYLDEKSTSDEIRSIQNVVIWVITALSTATVISGLQGTILHVCHLAVGLTTLLMVAAFLLDDKKFLLNLIVQEVGMFFQMNILQNNFWTDAFGQLQEGSGRAVDGKAADQFWME